jgi:DNA polymerase
MTVPSKPGTPLSGSLGELGAAEAQCTRCPLYAGATQVVPGEGVVGASVMLVGEQPGDKEDVAGKPFVGPAGRILDRALEQAGIARRDAFITNAVKHFKHEWRGKRRLHKRPNAYEIERCKWWLELERSIVAPAVIVALGATAAQAIFGRSTGVGAMRGRAHTLEDGTCVFVTVHPSLLLRIRDESEKQREFLGLVADLRQAAAASSR